MAIEPTSTRILVEEVAQEEIRESGIIISANVTGTNTKAAKVIAIGSGVDGISVGDSVYVDWTKGAMIRVEGKSQVFIESEFVLGRIK